MASRPSKNILLYPMRFDFGYVKKNPAYGVGSNDEPEYLKVSYVDVNITNGPSKEQLDLFEKRMSSSISEVLYDDSKPQKPMNDAVVDLTNALRRYSKTFKVKRAFRKVYSTLNSLGLPDEYEGWWVKFYIRGNPVFFGNDRIWYIYLGQSNLKDLKDEFGYGVIYQ